MKGKLKKVLIATGALGVVGVFIVGFVFLYNYMTLPKIDSLNNYEPSLPTQILSEDGQILLRIGLEDRELVEIKDIPNKVKDAFLAAEDNNFYEHSGVDYVGLVRATLKNISAGRIVQGGSTITQQVAKTLLLSRERSLARKIKDFLLAQQIEKKFSKDEILFLYLNQVYLGGGYYGVKAAFKGYFGKELAEVDAAEAALVAGLLVAPGRYSPYLNPEFAKTRQSYVLTRMLETQKIDQAEYDEAKNMKLKLMLRRPNILKAGYFTDWVRQEMNAKIGEDEFVNGGYRVVTTLNWDLQQEAEKAVIKGLREIDKRQGYNKPTENISLKDDLKDVEIEMRKEIFQAQSNFFYLTTDGKKEFELDFDEEAFGKLISERNEQSKKNNYTRFLIGNSENEDLLSLLRVGEEYDAYVLKTDNKYRLIYFSIAGIRGIIPYDSFKWAYEREINEERHYKSFVTEPSTIVKPGDKILVKISKLKSSLWNNLLKEKKQVLSSKDLKSFLNSQKFLQASLEQKPEIQGALISMNPHNGHIVSMVGGSDFDTSQFNRAIQSVRQPGSSFKPFLYALGLEEGFTAADILMDSPEALGGADETLNWKPQNYDNKFLGPITFRRSLEMSRNVTTIKLASKVGVDKIINFLQRIGFNAEMEKDLSLSLGSFGITLLDLVKSYAIFPNGGLKITPKSILNIYNRDGEEVDLAKLEKDRLGQTQQKADDGSEDDNKVIVESAQNSSQPELAQGDSDENTSVNVNPFIGSLNGDQVYDERLAYIMTNLLRGVVQNGTGQAARGVSSFIGGKTGTTNNYVDAWFMGFSSSLVTGVWTGFDDNKTMGWPETGSKSALPIWADFMKSGLKKFGDREFRVPGGIINVLVDQKSGQLQTNVGQGAVMETFVKGTEPGNENPIFKQEEDNQSTQIFEDADYYNE